MALLQYLSVMICMYTIITMAQGNVIDRHNYDLNFDGNGKMSLLERRKRMNGCDFVCRCWEDVNGPTVNDTLPEECIYINQNEHLCYRLMQLSKNNIQAVQTCISSGYELADINSALILDGIAKQVRSVIASDSSEPNRRYWLHVNSKLQNVSTTGSCSTYNDFSPANWQCTYLQIKENVYEVKDRWCGRNNNGFICQKKIVTSETPTTRLVNKFTDDDITTINYKVTQGVTSTQNPEKDVSKMSTAVIPTSINEVTRDLPTALPSKIVTNDDITTLSSWVTATWQSEQDVYKMSNVFIPITASAVAVACIVVSAILLIKRQNSKNGASGTGPPNLEIHDVPTTQVNQQSHGDNSSNKYTNYGASLPGDYAQLSDTAQKYHNPNYTVVDGNVYNNQYEIPMLPLSAENAKAETQLNNPQYDVIQLEEERNNNPQYEALNREKEGSIDSQYYLTVLNRENEGSLDPQYDTLNREKEGNFNHQNYDVLNRANEGSLDPQYDVLNCEKEGRPHPQYDVLNRKKEGKFNPQNDVLNRKNEGSSHLPYDVLNREKAGSFNPQYNVLSPGKRGEQSPVVYPEDVEDEMPEDEYFYGDFKQ